MYIADRGMKDFLIKPFDERLLFIKYLFTVQWLEIQVSGINNRTLITMNGG